jgi:membrane protein YqaA with SNARE-associated domain
MLEFSADSGLLALAAASFVAATILPGGSELALVGVLHRYPDLLWRAIGVATLFNTLGGLTSYALGRLLPNRIDARALQAVRRYGAWVLLFSWLPVIGDALAVGAGWLRLNLLAATAAFAVGKLCRYCVVAGAWSLFEAAALR